MKINNLNKIGKNSISRLKKYLVFFTITILTSFLNVNAVEADYNKVVKLKPNCAESYFDRGITKAFQKDYNGVINDCNKAIEITPRYF